MGIWSFIHLTKDLKVNIFLSLVFQRSVVMFQFNLLNLEIIEMSEATTMLTVSEMDLSQCMEFNKHLETKGQVFKFFFTAQALWKEMPTEIKYFWRNKLKKIKLEIV